MESYTKPGRHFNHQPIEASKRFLDHFPDERRSFVSTQFHHAARAGAGNPANLLADVADQARRRIADPYCEPDRRQLLHNLLAWRLQDRIGAEAYGRYVLADEALPRDARERLKAERSEQHRQAWLQQQLPTEKQLDYLRNLGYCGAQPATRGTASALIDQLLPRRGA